MGLFLAMGNFIIQPVFDSSLVHAKTLQVSQSISYGVFWMGETFNPVKLTGHASTQALSGRAQPTFDENTGCLAEPENRLHTLF